MSSSNLGIRHCASASSFRATPRGRAGNSHGAMNSGQLRSRMRNPDFDIDLKIGQQSELWVSSIRDLMALGNGAIEVKAPKPFLKEGSAYIEYECKGRDGVW